jgi:hypothetical protein
MSKTSKADFEYFQESCLEYQKSWGLTGWELHFEHKKLDQLYASCNADICGRIATIALSIDWGEDLPVTKSELHNTAKHEMLHLLLSRTHSLGRSRFTTDTEIDESNEEAVRILEKIVP